MILGRKAPRRMANKGVRGIAVPQAYFPPSIGCGNLEGQEYEGAEAPIFSIVFCPPRVQTVEGER